MSEDAMIDVARKRLNKGKVQSANDRQVGGEHYKTGGDQHWDLFGLDYLIGYATKYMRWRKKGGIQDLEKAIHVIEKIKEVGRNVPAVKWPVYDSQRVGAWARNAGLDWVEHNIVELIMFGQTQEALDNAIAGIRYLIASQQNPSQEKGSAVTDGHVDYQALDKCSGEALAMEVERLDALIARAPSWGAALTAYDESLKAVRAEIARRERRVPLFPQKQRTPEDGGQHASAHPWIVSTEWLEKNPRREHLLPFYKKLGTVLYVLDASVNNHAMPVELQKCYAYNSDAGCWVIEIERVPEDVREYYPRLQREMNSKELDDAPQWQRRLYAWSTEGNKHVLRSEAWAREAT